MQINNIEGLSGAQIRQLVSQGGKFVMYKRCISLLVVTFNNPTDIYFIKPGESAVAPGIGVLLINLFLGWWGIPWGPIYTIGNIATILGGGKNITPEVMAHINQQDASYGTGANYNLPGHEMTYTEPTTNNSNNNSGGYNIPSVNANNNSTSSNSNSSYNMPNNTSSNSSSNSSSNNAYNVPDKK